MIEFDKKILKKDVLVKVTDENQLMTLLKWGDSKGFKWVSGCILLDNDMINTLNRSLKLEGCVFLNLNKRTSWGPGLSDGSRYVDYGDALFNKKVLHEEKSKFNLKQVMSIYKDIANVVFLPGRKITIVVLKTHEIGVAMLQNGDIYDEEKGFLYAYVKALRSKFIWGSKYLEK